jgi:hypothetical protein
MGRLRQRYRVTTLVAPKGVTLAALLERRAEHGAWRWQVRAAAVRTLHLLVMTLALAALAGIAIAGYAVIR